MADRVFISYVKENKRQVDRLFNSLTKRGVQVWLDRKDIKPGQLWKDQIKNAIRDGACFLACFSKEHASREKSYMNEELRVAIEQLRLMPHDKAWFIPVALNKIDDIPSHDIGGGRSLTDLHWVPLYDNWEKGIESIMSSIRKRPAEVRPAEVRPAEVRPAEVRPAEVRPASKLRSWWPYFFIFILICALIAGGTLFITHKPVFVKYIMTLAPNNAQPPPPMNEFKITLRYVGHIKENDTFFYKIDDALIKSFERYHSIKVNHEPQQDVESDAAFEQLNKRLNLLQNGIGDGADHGGQDQSIDVVAIDQVWVEDLSDKLIDLKPYVDKEQYDEALIEHNTIKGRLVAIPWFQDVGVLYYNDDIINDKPPSTWEALDEIINKHKDIDIGFLWEAQPNEGLTCNALEWIAASGAVDQNNRVTLESDEAHKAVSQLRKLSSSRLLHIDRESLISKFAKGEAIFLRKWASDYMHISNLAKSENNIRISALPNSNEDLNKTHFGVSGGWQLAIPSSSKNQKAAGELVRYLTNKPVQKWRALNAGYVPTISEVNKDKDVKKTIPYDVIRSISRIVRSAAPGKVYEKESACFYKAMFHLLNMSEEEFKKLDYKRFWKESECSFEAKVISPPEGESNKDAVSVKGRF